MSNADIRIESFIFEILKHLGILRTFFLWSYHFSVLFILISIKTQCFFFLKKKKNQFPTIALFISELN